MRSVIAIVAAASAFVSAGCSALGNKPAASAGPITISRDGQSAAEPAIAAAPNGSVYTLYVEHHPDQGADLFLQPLDGSFKPEGERVRINDTAGTVKAWRGDPPTIAFGRDGTIFVGWTRGYPDPGSRGSDLMLSVSHDSGRTFATAAKVNDDTIPAAHGLHSLAIGQDGRVIMAWLDERNVRGKPHEMNMSGGEMHHDEGESNSEVFAAYSSDGGRTFSPNVRVAADACPCCKTSLLSAADGAVYLSWRQVLAGDHRHIAVAASHDGGRTFGSGVIVSNDNWQLSACPVSGAALASTAENEVEVTWYTAGAAGPPGLYFSRSKDGAKTFSERQLVGPLANSGTPVLAGKDCVFNSGDGAVSIAIMGEDSTVERTFDVANAGAPAAVSVGGKIIVAFVRPDQNSSSVMAEVVNL